MQINRNISIYQLVPGKAINSTCITNVHGNDSLLAKSFDTDGLLPYSILGNFYSIKKIFGWDSKDIYNNCYKYIYSGTDWFEFAGAKLFTPYVDFHYKANKLLQAKSIVGIKSKKLFDQPNPKTMKNLSDYFIT